MVIAVDHQIERHHKLYYQSFCPFFPFKLNNYASKWKSALSELNLIGRWINRLCVLITMQCLQSPPQFLGPQVFSKSSSNTFKSKHHSKMRINKWKNLKIVISLWDFFLQCKAFLVSTLLSLYWDSLLAIAPLTLLWSRESSRLQAQVGTTSLPFDEIICRFHITLRVLKLITTASRWNWSHSASICSWCIYFNRGSPGASICKWMQKF